MHKVLMLIKQGMTNQLLLLNCGAASAVVSLRWSGPQLLPVLLLLLLPLLLPPSLLLL
jgi:hypothetical protein